MTRFGKIADLTKAQPGVLTEVHEVIRYRELVSNLVSRDLKVRYKRSVLGFFWTMLSPLLMMTVTTIVFSRFFRFSIDNFPIYFLAAFLLWNFFAQSTTAGATIMLNNASVLRRVYVPKTVFVVSVVISGLINLLLSLLVLLLIMLVIGHPIGLSLLWLPIPLFLALLFTLGFSLAISALGVFFPDVAPMYQIILTAWMYMTPILYPLEIIPQEYLPLIYLNPMYYITESFRAPIYLGLPPDGSYLLISLISAVITLWGGWWVFSKSMDRFVFYV